MSANRSPERSRVLLTGASGYVGGRLLKLLEVEGFVVRCLARRPEYLQSRAGPGTEVVVGDVLDPSSLVPALQGMQTAYYLVHALGSVGSFVEREYEGARNFGRAAKEAGVRRIVYLGGLADESQQLSDHLRSRVQVGHLLAESGIPAIEFRASIVIGSGSLSFELIRALVERLPVMVTPRWVSVTAQPIAVEDVLAYLRAALEMPVEGHRVFEIGGADRVSYGEIMREYARQRGLRRWMIPVPFLTPRLSSLWLGLVTPVYARIGRKLIESIRNPSVVCDTSARDAFSIRPMGIRDAIARALNNEDNDFAETCWHDALAAAGPLRSWGGVPFGSRLVDSRTVRLPFAPERAFRPVERIGGKTGWYYGNSLWRLRGFLDLLVGGVGLRRGRRDPECPHVGEALDFWRVESYEPGRRLRLQAEMKVPGRAWLEFEAIPDGNGTILRQTATFDPHGLAGRLYWYALYPLHRLVFAGMLRGIAAAAEAGERACAKTGNLRTQRTR